MGTVKKTALDEFNNPRKVGIIAVDLDEGDYLIGAALTDGKHDVMLFSDGGKAVRFDENDVRPTGPQHARRARHDAGDGQSVIAMLVAEDEQQSVLTATENGYGKRTPITEYTRHGRGTKGMIAIQQSERNGKVVAATLVHADDEIMLITDKGVLVRTRVSEIRELGRATQGVTLIGLDEGSKLSGLQRIVENDARRGRRRSGADADRQRRDDEPTCMARQRPGRPARRDRRGRPRTAGAAQPPRGAGQRSRRAQARRRLAGVPAGARGAGHQRPAGRQPGPAEGRATSPPSGARSCPPAARWRRRSAWPTSGPAGTFSEQAAMQFFGSSIEHVPCVSFDEVFHATTAGTADFGVVPVENNTEGVVDALARPAAATRRCTSSARSACWCGTTCCAGPTRSKASRSCWRIRRRWRSARAG